MPSDAEPDLLDGCCPPLDADQLIADELAGINARLDKLEAKFDESAKRIEVALDWVVAVVRELRSGGLTGILRGTARKGPSDGR